MNTKTFIPIFLTFVTISIISVSGCERIRHVITSETITPVTMSTVKIGVIQPSGLGTNFTKGAELARSQINEAGGLLGMPVEFIVMDNQGNSESPDAAESVRIAKTLIEREGVVAILGTLLSANSMQVGAVATELRRPIITGSSGEFGEKVTATSEFVFLTVNVSLINNWVFFA